MNRTRALVLAGLFLGCQSDEKKQEPAPSTKTEEPEATPEPQPEPEPPEPSNKFIEPDASSGLKNFVAQMPEPDLAWVGPMKGNGNRDVLVYVPSNADPNTDYQLIYHFHGTHGQRIKKKRDGMPKKKWVGWERLGQTIEATDQLAKERDHNVVLVYPISAGKRLEPGYEGPNNKFYDRMWMVSKGKKATDDFTTLHGEVLDVLNEHLQLATVQLGRPAIAEGHSAGGIALRAVAQTGTDVVGEYLFLDASFESWADGCHTALKKRGKKALVTMVVTENGIADPFGKHDPWCVEFEQGHGAWPQFEAACTEDPTTKPEEAKLNCERMQEGFGKWPDLEAWCGDYPNDMKNSRGVYLHRTKVFHGNQPRHFVGGLELPADRFDALKR